jgi:acyl carrier protein
MLPATFVFLDTFPLTPNGKIDRRALPAPDQQSDPTTYVAPRDETEALLAQLWGELLGVAQVGVYENFFDLGGHSLLATRLVLRLREGFGIDLAVRTLFEAPTVASLAEHIATLQWIAQSAGERVDVADLAYDHGEI